MKKILIALLLVSIFAPRSFAAVDMFLQIGDIEGESVDKVHAKKIDVLAWSWGISNSGTTHVGGGGGAGKANFQDLSFTKYLDKATAPLMKGVATGAHFPTANLIIRKAGVTKPYEFLKIEMTDVLVTSLSTGGSGGEDRFTENVTLNFAKVKVEYFSQSPAGVVATAGMFIFDIAGNVAE